MKDQWIEWLEGNQRNFFYGVTIVIFLFFIAFQLFGKFHKSTSSNYHTANLAFEKWILQGGDFESVENAITSHPELETKFGALIAEKFLAQNQGEKAKSFAESVLSRVLKQTPEHAHFAKTSLLISRGNLNDALSSALALKEQLDDQSLLCGFNLFRIASLYRALDNLPQERSALVELENYMAINPSGKAVLLECFSEGEITLANYISQRIGK